MTSALQARPCLRTAREVRRSFVEALNGAHLGVAAACFARSGCLITPDATAIHGREAIAAVLVQLIDRATKIEVVLSDALEAGETVLSCERWRIRSNGARAGAFVQESRATVAASRIESEWKLSILAPWGWGVPAAALVPITPMPTRQEEAMRKRVRPGGTGNRITAASLVAGRFSPS